MLFFLFRLKKEISISKWEVSGLYIVILLMLAYGLMDDVIYLFSLI